MLVESNQAKWATANSDVYIFEHGRIQAGRGIDGRLKLDIVSIEMANI